MGKIGYKLTSFLLKVFSPEKTLWMPDGSVRALIALMLTFSICYGFLKLQTVESNTMENLIFLVLGYYFGKNKRGNGMLNTNAKR